MAGDRYAEAMQRSDSAWRNKLYEVIFESETPAGRTFDRLLLVVILFSVSVVVLDSVAAIHTTWGTTLGALEWGFTGLFTVEYGLRLCAVRRPGRYALSFFGIIDLLSILPSYLSLVFPGAQSLQVVRTFRLLRVFRVLRLAELSGQADVLQQALWASRQKITVFIATVLMVVTVVGAAMYLIEGPEHGYTNIPVGMYWAVITLTTVGFGDITPKTALGQFLASCVTVLGYGIIAVPTGIVTVELGRAMQGTVSTEACPACGRSGHDVDAVHCKYCGERL
jgi:voltage-gated potassium channel